MKSIRQSISALASVAIINQQIAAAVENADMATAQDGVAIAQNTGG